MWLAGPGHQRHRLIAFPAFLALISTPAWLLCAAAFADPSPLVQGSANPLLVAEHPTISLDRELLVFEPLSGLVRVTAELVFHNHADACVVPMQFPILTWATDSEWDHVTGLTVEVDGEALEAVEIPHRNIILQGKKHYAKTYAFSVPFEAGAPLHMKVRYYQTGYGLVQVPYVLATGGTWRGPIRDFRLEMRLGERLNFHDLRLTGDDRPLAYEERDDTLTWRCTDYAGDPELLWFHAGRGPAYVVIDGNRYERGRYRDTLLPVGEPTMSDYDGSFAWQDGRLLVDYSLLGQITMLRVPRRPRGDSVTATRGSNEVTLPARNLPVRYYAPGGRLADLVSFAEPEMALRAFGGEIDHGLTQDGDLWVSVRSAPLNSEAAIVMALGADQPCEYRLRCLRRLAEQWPEALPGVAHELCSRPTEDPRVLLAVVGHLADDVPEFAAPEAVFPRLRLNQPDAPVHEIIRLLGQQREDALLRGAGMALAVAKPLETREHILEKAAEGKRQRPQESRNVGLILRAVKDGATRQKLMDTAARCEDEEQAQLPIVLLGYLGENEAIPFLSRIALGNHAWEDHRYVDGQAAQALTRIGTEEALVACVALLSADPAHHRVQVALLPGLADAVGAPCDGTWYPDPMPDWARLLSVDDTRAVLAPLADQIPAQTNEYLKTVVAAIIDCIGPRPQPARTASSTEE